MMERIRDGLWYLRLNISALLQRPRRAKGRYVPPVKGNMRSVVVIKPENEMFDQAVFILSDSYLRQHSASSEEILQQARNIVEQYRGNVPAPGGRLRLLLWAILLLLFAAALYFLIF